MPWSLVGYTQYRYLPLIQFAEVGGLFAITWALCAVNGGIAEWWRSRADGVKAWRAVVPGGAAFALLAAYGLATVGRSYGGDSIRLALIQPNERSFRDEAPETGLLVSPVMDSVARIGRMSERAADAKADLIVWPESAVPQSPLVDAYIREALQRGAQRTGAWQLLGSGHEDEKGKIYNSAFLFRPDGELSERYDKTWLVPFGEWVPLRPILPFDNVFHFPADLTAGRSDALVSAGKARMCVLICYETVFPIVSRTRVAKGANLLVSITNDSWAGESAELQQHVAMSAMRAVETRRYLASSATTGITGLIHPNGRIEAVPPYREDLLITEAKLLDGQTIYVRWGDWVVAMCGAWIILLFCTAKTPSSARNAEE
jgi:apolipoprotein N-acyltransferase